MKGSVIMVTKNDETVLQLKRKLDKKRDELASMKPFVPETNLVLELEGLKTNLNVLDEDSLKRLKIKLHLYEMSMKDLELYLPISGYRIDQWMHDIDGKIETVSRKNKEKELKQLEAKLDKLLSDDKKVELELQEIAGLLG